MISIIIPAYNEEKALEYTLPKNIEAIKNADAEIIVVDNNSTDKTSDIAKAHHDVDVVTESKKGTSAARQAGYKAAKGDILVFVDADTYITSEWIEKLQSIFTKNPKIVAISGGLFFYDCPEWYRFLYKIVWYILFCAYKIRIVKPFVLGTSFAVRKETLDSMNGFNIELTFYGDDTDIGLRANEFGKVVFTPRITCSTSARRYRQQGLFKTLGAYFINHFSVYWRGRPFHEDSQDYR